MEELRWMSACDQLRLVASREVTPTELRDAGIASCAAANVDIGFAVSTCFDRAPGGVPMLLKDAGQELAGTPHFVGLAALRDASHTSTTTTFLARRFEELGFSIIAKAACPPLSGTITTEPPGFAPTRNPWDLSRSAGGSSGGSAAAVASGAVPIAHGSDATGSLRCPAALCGVATLNPTSGLIPTVPPAGQPQSIVWRDFVLARHAEDLTLVFEGLSGQQIPKATGSLRVGLLDHDPEMGLPVHPACAAAVAHTAALLEKLGHRVESIWPAAFTSFWARAWTPVGIISDASRQPMIEWVSQRLGRAASDTGLSPEVFEAAKRSAARTPSSIADAHSAISQAVEPLKDWWHDHDLLVTPSTFQPAWRLGGDPGPRELGTLAAPFSLSGQPSLSLPVHHDHGLPIGVQIVGRTGSDAMLLRLAQDLQRLTNWTDRRPPSMARLANG